MLCDGIPGWVNASAGEFLQTIQGREFVSSSAPGQIWNRQARSELKQKLYAGAG